MDGSQPRPWVWYGGTLFADFVNTRKERFGAGVELLEVPADLDGWFDAAGLPARAVPVGQDVLREARALREAIDELIRGVVGDRVPAGPALATVNAWLEIPTATRCRLGWQNGELVLAESDGASGGPRTVLARIAHDAADMLGTGERRRLRICGGESCSARFVDHSAGQRRRWCQMGVCGNRAKAARHRRAHSPA
jgi:predicted RNA-binding Zn ribbon-like protein